jgi:hypothetical protein
MAKPVTTTSVSGEVSVDIYIFFLLYSLKSLSGPEL